MIKSEIDATVAGIRALSKAGGKDVQFSVSDRERAAMTHKMNKARDIENMKDDPVWFKQHREDTKYKQWQDGMYVKDSDLKCDYERALIENSLRNSVYYLGPYPFLDRLPFGPHYGVFFGMAGAWVGINSISSTTKLTRAQALYIATGDTDI
jgi:hypothetical protein